MLSTKQLADNGLMMFSPRITPQKHVLLPLLNHKCLKANPNHHLPNKYAHITLADFARIAYIHLMHQHFEHRPM